MNSGDSNLKFLRCLLTGFDEQLASVAALDDLFTAEAVSHGRELLKDEWALRRNEIFLLNSASNITACSENTSSTFRELELSENHQDEKQASTVKSGEEEPIVAEEEKAVKIEFDGSRRSSPEKDQRSTSNAPVIIDSDSNDGYEPVPVPVREEDKNDFDLFVEDSDIEEAVKEEVNSPLKNESDLEDEEEELRKIIELSKQTAREEERRRSQSLPESQEKQANFKGRKLKRTVIYDSDDDSESDDDKPRRKSMNKRKRSALSSDEDNEENRDSEGSLEANLQDIDESQKKFSPKKAKGETKKKNVFLDSQAGGNKSAQDLEKDEFDSDLDDFIDDSEFPESQSQIPDESSFSSRQLQQAQEIFDDSDIEYFDSNDEDDRPSTSSAMKRKPQRENQAAIIVEDLERTGTVEARMALKRVFGYDRYRPSQWKLIDGVCRGQDQLGIMATGYGKSICFQMPSILLKKLTICISPLISLMKDQTMKLETFGVKAGYLGSSAKKADVKRVHDLIDSQELRVLYLTPEFSVNNIEKVRDIHRRHAICCFAIDECHCVSQWGHDFRDEYRQLHKLRMVDRKIPFLAMTATATPAVRDDIVRNLRLISPQKVVTSFDRSNLKLFVREKTDENTILPDLMATGCLVQTREVRRGGISIHNPNSKKLHFAGCTIIYCRSRESTELLAKELKKYCGNSKIGAYHAGLPEKTKLATHEGFVDSSIDCVVATIAFGMGVDKGNVRYVIHNEPPGAPESYYQEIGRAGRDGEQSEAHLIFSKKGIGKMAYFARLEKDFERAQLMRANAKKMETYINTQQCRRLPLLRHFDPDATSSVTATPKCCDNCEGGNTTAFYEVKEEANFGSDAAIVFECLAEFSTKPSRTMLQLHIRGSKAKQLKPEMQLRPSWGKGKEKSNDYWKELIFALVGGDYLAETECYNAMGYGHAVLMLTPKATDWLRRFRRDRGGVELLLPQSEKLSGAKSSKTVASNSSNQPAELNPVSANKEELPEMSIPGLDHRWLERFMEGPWKKQVRAKEETKTKEEEKQEKRACRDLFAALAEKNKEKPPSLHLTATKLKDLCLHRPSNAENCAQISGFTRIEADAHSDIIEFIKKFCEERNLAMNKQNAPVISDQKIPNLFHELDGKQKALPIHPQGFERDVYDYLKVGMSLSEIQKELALSDAALAKTITKIVDYGHAVEASAFGVTIEHVKSLEKMIRENGNVIPAPSRIMRTIGQININYVPLLVTLTKLRFGMTSIFPRDTREYQERRTAAIKQHTAASSRPGLNNFNSTTVVSAPPPLPTFSPMKKPKKTYRRKASGRGRKKFRRVQKK